MKSRNKLLILILLLITLISIGSVCAANDIDTGNDPLSSNINENQINHDSNENTINAYKIEKDMTDTDKLSPDGSFAEDLEGDAYDDSGNALEDEINEMNGKKSNSNLESSNLQSTITIDGSASNQMINPTIQEAINNAKSGDTIIITGKNYVHCHFIVNKKLTIISNVGTALSPCPSNTQGSGTYGLFYISPEASGTIIKGFTFTNLIDEEDCYGALVREASDVQIINCTVNSTQYGDGIRLENAKNTHIENCLIKNSNIGINIINSSKTIITNNNISNNSVTGIFIRENNSNTTINTNNITYNKNTGISIISANNIYIINNLIAYNRNGDANSFTSGAGVYVNCNITKIEIKGNYIRQNGLYGVLNDYRTRNMDARIGAENLEIINNNYFLGHKERIAYHIEYKPYEGGEFTYDSENDLYIYVGEGNGNYDIDKSVVYLGYAYFEAETICGATLFKAPSTTWGSANYALKLSEISQVKKGIYKVSIVDKDGNIARDISSIYVTFYLNKNNSFADPQSGDIYKTVLMQNGTATADFTNEKFSDSGNVITACFPGLYNYYTVNPHKTFAVDDEEIPGNYHQTKISASNIKLVPSSGENFTIKLIDENQNAVKGEKVSFTIGTSTYTRTTDENGKASLKINLAYTGTYSVTIKYAGSENYNKSSAKATITIKKQTPTIVSSNVKLIPASGEDYAITLKDENGKAIANKKVSFTIGTSTYTRTTDENGKATLKINLAYAKKYPVIIKSGATSQYNAVNKTNTITIQAGSKTVKLTASNATFVPYSGKYYDVFLKDGNNNGIANKKVSFTIGTSTYTRTTDENGKASLKINLATQKKYNITLKFTGDEVYSPSTIKRVITIKKANPNLIAYNRTYISKSGQSFSVTLKDYEGKPLGNQNVTFELSVNNSKNSGNYTKTTNSDGVAELTINLNSLKAFKIITKYAGDREHNPINKTNYINILNESNTCYIDPNLPNSEIQRILDNAPESYNIKFLGKSYDDINIIINKSLNIFSDVNTALNGKSEKTVIAINSDYVNISNLFINANSTRGYANGISINNSNNVALNNNIIKNILDNTKLSDYKNGSTVLPGRGIEILNSSKISLSNNSVSSFESALYSEYSDDVEICKNEFALSNYGIKYGFGNSNTRITNNTIKDNIGWYTMDVPEGPRGYGIFLNNSAVNITINQNNISNNYIGISIDANNSTGIIITSNLIADNSLEGIRFNEGYDLAENAIEPNVTDNAIYRNAEGPSMMILGEMSANPNGIYGAGQWDEELRLKLDANWYGVNSLRTWDYESGIVGVGTMCPRIKTTTIKFETIETESPGNYKINFYKNGELATNLASFDIYATLNRNTDKKTEVHFYVINGTGTFSFDKADYLDSGNTIEISVGSLINVIDRIYTVVYTYNIPDTEIPN